MKKLENKFLPDEKERARERERNFELLSLRSLPSQTERLSPLEKLLCACHFYPTLVISSSPEKEAEKAAKNRQACLSLSLPKKKKQ